MSGQTNEKNKKQKTKKSSVQNKIEFMIGKAERTLNTQRDKEYHTRGKKLKRAK